MVGTVSSTDISTKENLEALVQVGESLLKKPVSRVNLRTGVAEPVQNGGNNEEALTRYISTPNLITLTIDLLFDTRYGYFISFTGSLNYFQMRETSVF